jgi:serine/threonine protein kinase
MLDFSAISDGVKLELHKVRQLAEREVNALKTLDHPNIIKLLHYTIDTTLQATYMAFEYYPHQDLLDYLERSEYKGSVLLECFAKGIFHQLVSAVQHCHENNICHGDIKPDNILIANRDSIFSCKKVTVPHIVLIDFGLSQVFSRSDDGKESFLNEVIGSPGYVAPEIIERNPYHGTKIDVWSLGVFLYCTLFCEYPYKLDQTARDPWTKIVSLMKAHKFHFPSSIPVSQRAKDLIRRMLCYNPTERITVCEILTDRWFDCLR